jgi:hypothetical protein
MDRIEFPQQLEDLLKGSSLYPAIRALADRVGEILEGSKLPFFPDYTDHGVEHVNRVLKSEVELVPKEVWERSQQGSRKRLRAVSRRHRPLERPHLQCDQNKRQASRANFG